MQNLQKTGEKDYSKVSLRLIYDEVNREIPQKPAEERNLRFVPEQVENPLKKEARLN